MMRVFAALLLFVSFALVRAQDDEFNQLSADLDQLPKPIRMGRVAGPTTRVVVGKPAPTTLIMGKPARTTQAPADDDVEDEEVAQILGRPIRNGRVAGMPALTTKRPMTLGMPSFSTKRPVTMGKPARTTQAPASDDDDVEDEEVAQILGRPIVNGRVAGPSTKRPITLGMPALTTKRPMTLGMPAFSTKRPVTMGKPARTTQAPASDDDVEDEEVAQILGRPIVNGRVAGPSTKRPITLGMPALTTKRPMTLGMPAFSTKRPVTMGKPARTTQAPASDDDVEDEEVAQILGRPIVNGRVAGPSTKRPITLGMPAPLNQETGDYGKARTDDAQDCGQACKNHASSCK
jgi:hypothetical protein